MIHAVSRPKRPARCALVHRQIKPVRARAFSLVEVTLALGIMGFAFVSILGMVPLGLKSFRETKNVDVASQIAQQIFAEVQNTTFAELTGSLSPGQSWRLPPPGSQTQSTSQATNTPLRYFDEQGLEVSSTDPTATANAVYQVNVRVLASTPFVQNAATAAAPSPNPALAGVTIQVAYNPGNLSMDHTSDVYFWTGTSGASGQNKGISVPMFTYETLVARNF